MLSCRQDKYATHVAKSCASPPVSCSNAENTQAINIWRKDLLKYSRKCFKEGKITLADVSTVLLGKNSTESKESDYGNHPFERQPLFRRVAGDGNCFWRALLQAMGIDPDANGRMGEGDTTLPAHLMLRRDVVKLALSAEYMVLREFAFDIAVRDRVKFREGMKTFQQRIRAYSADKFWNKESPSFRRAFTFLQCVAAEHLGKDIITLSQSENVHEWEEWGNLVTPFLHEKLRRNKDISTNAVYKPTALETTLHLSQLYRDDRGVQGGHGEEAKLRLQFGMICLLGTDDHFNCFDLTERNVASVFSSDKVSHTSYPPPNPPPTPHLVSIACQTTKSNADRGFLGLGCRWPPWCGHQLRLSVCSTPPNT